MVCNPHSHRAGEKRKKENNTEGQPAAHRVAHQVAVDRALELARHSVDGDALAGRRREDLTTDRRADGQTDRQAGSVIAAVGAL